MTDLDSQALMQDCQADLVAALDLDDFSTNAYTSTSYLEAVLEAGVDAVDIATAHDVSKRSTYRMLTTRISSMKRHRRTALPGGSGTTIPTRCPVTTDGYH